MDTVAPTPRHQVRCNGCGQSTPGYQIVNYGSIERGHRQLCSRCFNTEIAKAAGLEGFEHANFEPVGLTDGRGELHEFHFRTHLLGPSVSLDAFELRDGEPAGYYFQIIGDPEDDLLVLLGRLIEKMRHALSVQHLKDGDHGLQIAFGLEVSCSGLYRALARLARRAAPTYAGLVKATRQAPVNVPDETGWKVGGHLQWMHVSVSEQVTVYAILPGRGYDQSVVILGAAYAGFLVHDGWAPYYRFVAAFHQSCLRHLLIRCREMARIASPAAAAFPFTVKDLLRTGLQLRDRYQEGEISEHGLRSATGRLEARLDRLLEKSYRHPANRRLARHLQHERPYLFTFLYYPGLDATNHETERAIWWMVIARKVWGGNRTWEGAWTQQVLVSVLRTCWQQGKDAFTRCVRLLRAPRGVILDIMPGAG